MANNVYMRTGSGRSLLSSRDTITVQDRATFRAMLDTLRIR
ncbi:hypothetical protein [Mycetocola lacteus]|nr:hypothetical protein [Mycetocola lacteus]